MLLIFNQKYYFLPSQRHLLSYFNSLFAEDCQTQEHVVNKTLKTVSQKFITQAIAHMHKNIHKHAHTFNFPLVQHSFPFSCSLDKGGFIWIFRWTSQNLFTLTYTQMSFQILGQNNVYDNLAVVNVSISVCKSRITFTIAYPYLVFNDLNRPLTERIQL